MKKPLLFLISTLMSFIFLFSAVYGKDCKKAKEYFKQALDLGGNTLALIKKEQLYRKAIELCPSYAEAHNNLGHVYEKQGRFEEAIAEYKKATELAPRAPYPYFGLGDIYYKTGRYKEAIKWYNKGLKYAPDDPLTNKILALIRDIQKGGIIKAETIRGMLSATRGPGEIVSITFGEGLIPFDFDKYDIRPDARPQLNEIGKALEKLFTLSKDISVESKEMPLIEIAGHTDHIGTDEYNMELSRKRAESVIDYLVRNFDIPRRKLIAKGYGERVPLCKTASDDKNNPCNALNRRVEIVRKPAGGEGTRTASFRGVGVEQNITMDVGFFYQRSKERQVKVLKEGTRLRSRLDKYFIFLRPAQDCYAYILQEDSKGKVDLIFPKKGKSVLAKRGRDYWIPGFGKAYTLDDVRGEEKLYLLATSRPLESEIEGLTLKEQVRGVIKALKSRAIYVVKASSAPDNIQEDELHQNPQKINELLSRIEGEGGWVKVVKFWHE